MWCGEYACSGCGMSPQNVGASPHHKNDVTIEFDA